MPLELVLPDEYGYVLFVASCTFFVNSYHTVLDTKARKKSGLKYPIAYASNELAEKDPNAFAHNCAQRAHANFIENLTPFLGALFISGLRWPVASASIGGAWAVSRVLYAAGYTSKAGPEGRVIGSVGHFLCDTALKFMALYAAGIYAFGS